MGQGDPIGEDLCSGTTNGNTLPENDSPLVWEEREITFATVSTLEAGTKYAIVIRAIDADGVDNFAAWVYETSEYAGGKREYSADSGETWEAGTVSTDQVFKEYAGEVLYENVLYDNSQAGAVIYGERWRAQTFTPSITHNITSVKLHLYRAIGAAPDEITVSIRATEPAPASKPINPTPVDTAVNVELGQTAISWEDGGGADSYNVYYGVNEAGLTLVSAEQVGTSFSIWHIANGSPFIYSESRTWRIDAVNDAGATTGDVWTFTTINGYPGIAANPDPGDGDTDVDIDGADDTGAVLTWDVSTCAKSYDVYFGTDPTPDATEFIRNQHGTTYNPGTLSSNTTYYWRIDAQNDNGTTTGSVWSFTTESSP